MVSSYHRWPLLQAPENVRERERRRNGTECEWFGGIWQRNERGNGRSDCPRVWFEMEKRMREWARVSSLILYTSGLRFGLRWGSGPYHLNGLK